MKRHRAAREVHSMKSWLKQAGRIHDFTGYDSEDEGDTVPGDTLAAKAERRKARREAHEDWVAPKVVTAPDGTQVVVRHRARAVPHSRPDAKDALPTGRRVRWLPAVGH